MGVAFGTGVGVRVGTGVGVGVRVGAGVAVGARVGAKVGAGVGVFRGKVVEGFALGTGLGLVSESAGSVRQEVAPNTKAETKSARAKSLLAVIDILF